MSATLVGVCAGCFAVVAWFGMAAATWTFYRMGYVIKSQEAASRFRVPFFVSLAIALPSALLAAILLWATPESNWYSAAVAEWVGASCPAVVLITLLFVAAANGMSVEQLEHVRQRRW